MPLNRGRSLNPAANEDTEILYATASYLVAIIASNMSDSKESRISVWVEPYEYLPISSGEEEEKRAYVIKEGSLPPNGSYESWRFAVNPEDFVYVKSNNGKASFTIELVAQ